MNRRAKQNFKEPKILQFNRARIQSVRRVMLSSQPIFKNQRCRSSERKQSTIHNSEDNLSKTKGGLSQRTLEFTYSIRGNLAKLKANSEKVFAYDQIMEQKRAQADFWGQVWRITRRNRFFKQRIVEAEINFVIVGKQLSRKFVVHSKLTKSIPFHLDYTCTTDFKLKASKQRIGNDFLSSASPQKLVCWNHDLRLWRHFF